MEKKYFLPCVNIRFMVFLVSFSTLFLIFSGVLWFSVPEVPFAAEILYIVFVLAWYGSVIPVLCNGIHMDKKGNVRILYGLRCIKAPLEQIERLEINLNRYRKCKYAVEIKLTLKNGETCRKDYVDIMRMCRGKNIYAISDRQARKLCGISYELDWISCRY